MHKYTPWNTENEPRLERGLLHTEGEPLEEPEAVQLVLVEVLEAVGMMKEGH